MVCASAQAKRAPAIPGGVVASASEKGHVLGSRQTGDVRGGPTLSERILTGLSSGEGLVWALRDPAAQDAGITERRLLALEPTSSRNS